MSTAAHFIDITWFIWCT